jgi:hypothetical protein
MKPENRLFSDDFFQLPLTSGIIGHILHVISFNPIPVNYFHVSAMKCFPISLKELRSVFRTY